MRIRFDLEVSPGLYRMLSPSEAFTLYVPAIDLLNDCADATFLVVVEVDGLIADSALSFAL